MPHLLVRLLALLLLLPAGVAGQEDPGDGDGGPSPDYPVAPLSVPRPALRAHALAAGTPIRVDGTLDEAAWSRADSTAGPWIQINPRAGHPATQRSVARVLYDRDRLYIGAVLYDEDPDGLVIPGLEQDFNAGSSDIFGVVLDTYHDRQNGFVFAVNPGGAVYDAQAFNDSQDLVAAWEGIIDVRTRIHDEGWTVEMAIPFSTLRFDPSEGPQTWGLNFTRRIRRLNEDSMWAPLPLQFRAYKFSMAGTLEGLRDLPQTRNLYLKPYVLGNRLGV